MIKAGDKVRFRSSVNETCFPEFQVWFYHQNSNNTFTVNSIGTDGRILLVECSSDLFSSDLFVVEPEHFADPLTYLKGYNGQLVVKNPPVNIDQFFVRDNTCTGDKKVWESSTLFQAAKGLEPYDLQLSALDLSAQFASSNTVALFLYQMKRVQESDLSYPIIQAPDGWIMDGLHRIVKAILQGESTIKAVRLPVLPEPDRIEP